MNIPGTQRPFVVVGENIHTTRVLSRKGKLVSTDAAGNDVVRFRDVANKRRTLAVPDAFKKTQDYEEGRVKHLKIAIQDAMAGGADGMDYLKRQIQRQEEAGSDFLDLNVDEISLKPEEQREGMRWLVDAVGDLARTPLAIDSSDIDTIRAGLEAARQRDADGPLMLNSASLERLDALDLAVEHRAQVVITAAGESGMPQNADERLAHASRMVEAATTKGIAPADIYIDPLVFPISVDSRYGNDCFEAIRRLRQDFGAEIRITGGFSNVSFGLPCRRLINDVFLLLAVEAGADSAIMDPTATALDEVFTLDRNARPYRLAEDMLLGRDEYCATFLRAYRKGELA